MPNNTDTLVEVFDDIAEAINNKGVAGTMTPPQMAAKIGQIPTGTTPTGTIQIATNGTHDVTNYATADVSVSTQDTLTQMLTSTLVSYTLSTNKPTYLTQYKFAYCSSLQTITCPNIIKTETGVFRYTGLTSLDTTNFPVLNEIGEYTFANCTSLTQFINTYTTNVRRSAFRECTNLVKVSIPENIGTDNLYAFYGCSKLTDVNLPKTKTFGSYCFQNCTSLKSFDAPSATSFGERCFNGCTSFELLNLYSASRTGIPTIGSNTVLTQTKIAAGTGHVVINDDLVDTLKAASNWASLPSGVIISHTEAVQQGIISA